jgi:hypothetical protein
MRISSSVSYAVEALSTKAIGTTEAKKIIGRAIYESLIDQKTIEQLNTHDKEMLDDVCGLLGIKLIFDTGRVIGHIGRKDGLDGTV